MTMKSRKNGKKMIQQIAPPMEVGAPDIHIWNHVRMPDHM